MAEPDYDDYTDHPEFRTWAKHVKDELIPKIRQSDVSLSILAGGDPDAKLAVELGMSILLDKPIILGIVPGTKVNDHLVRVADEIIEIDYGNLRGPGGDQTAQAIHEAIERVTRKQR